MIQKFRKKPVVIEAVKLEPNQASIKECYSFMGDTSNYETVVAQDRFTDYCNDIIKEGKGLRLKTLESDNETQIASFGDYIIKGLEGEFYPCKPDIFEKTYELIKD